MLITFQCPQCEATLEAAVDEAQTRVECPGCGAPITVPRKALGEGVTVGEFEIRRLLGKGGMGAVYLARQLSTDRDVALKILPPAVIADDEDVSRFKNEVHMAARLDHPHIVPVHGAGEDSGTHFMAMAYIEGESLAALLKQSGAMPEQEALHIARKVASALQFAWEKHHMLHRDIKPANIMLDPRGAPLRYLKIYNAPLKNLDALEGAPLETLILHTLPELTRLGPVTEAPLKRLEVCNTGVDDLSVLKGMELVTLVFEPYNVKRGISVVRNMESIQRIGVFGTPPMEPDEFWKLYDLGGFKEP